MAMKECHPKGLKVDPPRDLYPLQEGGFFIWRVIA